MMPEKLSERNAFWHWWKCSQKLLSHTHTHFWFSPVDNLTFSTFALQKESLCYVEKYMMRQYHNLIPNSKVYLSFFKKLKIIVWTRIKDTVNIPQNTLEVSVGLPKTGRHIISQPLIPCTVKRDILPNVSSWGYIWLGTFHAPCLATC